MTQPTPAEQPAPPAPKGKRAIRTRDNAARQPDENRAHTPGENR